MTVHVPIVTDTDPWPATCVAVNAWRGQCLAVLARAETSVSEALLVLAQVPDRGLKVTLPHLIGQRCDALSKAIASDGPFHAEGHDAIEALETYRAHGPLRNFLCHAPGKISRERNGRWLLVLKVLTFRANRAERSIFVIEEAESSEILGRLRADCLRLSNHLDILQRKLG